MKLKLTLLALMIFSISFAQNNFRNNTWGASKTSVISKEKSKKISDENNILTFESKLTDLNCKVMYYFTHSNKLKRAKYLISPEYLNMNLYIKDYKMFQDMLTQKYGTPKEKNIVTINKVQTSENEWSAHLLAGNIRFETIWKTEETTIFLTLSTRDGKTFFQIDYLSTEVFKLDEKERIERSIKDL